MTNGMYSTGYHDGDFGVLLFSILVLAGIAIFFLCYTIKHIHPQDIREYLRERDCIALSMDYDVFGPGWFGDNNAIYFVRYLDSDRNTHEAYFKAGFFSGVYSTQDEVVRRRAPPLEVGQPQRKSPRQDAPTAPPVRDDGTKTITKEALEMENARLRQLVNQLQKGGDR